MRSTVAELDVAVGGREQPLEVGWNWGLLLALGFCLAAWVAVIFGVALVL